MWLIVFGSGPESEALADRIAEQCVQHSITARKRAIDEYTLAELGRFPSLVVCLPALSSSTKVRQTLEPFATLVRNYRGSWYRGLRAVRDDGVDILDVGVVQLYGDTIVLHNPAMRSAYRTACYVQAIDAEPMIDALRPYRTGIDLEPRPTPWDEPDDVAERAILDAHALINRWARLDAIKVPVLLACIEDCRTYFEDPRKPALHRPIDGAPHNRLDCILDGVEPAPAEGPQAEKAVKCWNENGARVFRHVRDQLKKIVPDLARPGDGRAPGAQQDLRRLYDALKVVDAYQRGTATSLP